MPSRWPLFSNLWLKLVPSVSPPIEPRTGAERRAGQLRESPVARHISHGTAALTPNHLAFENLGNLRSAHLLGARVIDSDGNFIGNRHRRAAGGPDYPVRDNGLRAQGEKFMPWWEEEFMETEYKMDVFPKALVAAIFFRSLSVHQIIFSPVGSVPEDCPANSWSVLGKVRFSKVSCLVCLLYKATI